MTFFYDHTSLYRLIIEITDFSVGLIIFFIFLWKNIHYPYYPDINDNILHIRTVKTVMLIPIVLAMAFNSDNK